MIQIYTGDGKGKSTDTAVIGLMMRAAGAAKRAYFAQFMKVWPSAELQNLQNRPEVIVDRSWDGSFIIAEPTKKQKKLVKDQYFRVLQAMDRSFDLIVRDEILVAQLFTLLKEEDILDLMEQFPKDKELLITGRGAFKRVIEKAHLVSEMKKMKHYFDQGIEVRRDFEF